VCTSAKNTTTLGHGRVPTDCNDDDVLDLLLSYNVLLRPLSPFYVTQHKALVHAVSERYYLIVTIDVHVKRMATTRGECTCGRGESMVFDSVTSA
jgi:hypothetical protein